MSERADDLAQRESVQFPGSLSGGHRLFILPDARALALSICMNEYRAWNLLMRKRLETQNLNAVLSGVRECQSIMMRKGALGC